MAEIPSFRSLQQQCVVEGLSPCSGKNINQYTLQQKLDENSNSVSPRRNKHSPSPNKPSNRNISSSTIINTPKARSKESSSPIKSYKLSPQRQPIEEYSPARNITTTRRNDNRKKYNQEEESREELIVLGPQRYVTINVPSEDKKYFQAVVREGTLSILDRVYSNFRAAFLATVNAYENISQRTLDETSLKKLANGIQIKDSNINLRAYIASS